MAAENHSAIILKIGIPQSEHLLILLRLRLVRVDGEKLSSSANILEVVFDNRNTSTETN